MPKVPAGKSDKTSVPTSKNVKTTFKATATAKAPPPVAKVRPSISIPKGMTNMQQARNDSTAGIKSPITRMPPQERARIDSTNAVISAVQKKDREFRGFQARQTAAGRKSRGY